MSAPAVTLRPLVEADLETLFVFRNDPAASAMAEVPPREHDEFIRSWRERQLVDPDVVARAIDADGRLAGNILSFRLQPDGPLLVGYILGRDFWGKGIASRALAEFISRHEPRRPLCAGVSVNNPASMRVLEKSGFSREGAPRPAEDGVVEQNFVLER